MWKWACLVQQCLLMTKIKYRHDEHVTLLVLDNISEGLEHDDFQNDKIEGITTIKPLCQCFAVTLWKSKEMTPHFKLCTTRFSQTMKCEVQHIWWENGFPRGTIWQLPGKPNQIIKPAPLYPILVAEHPFEHYPIIMPSRSVSFEITGLSLEWKNE